MVSSNYFATGFDGCLYVVDMYRQHIEGPEFIPADLRADMNFNAGKNKGRIYRIVPVGYKYKFAPFDLETKTSQELVQLLSNPNRWWRLHAHKLLVERQDKSVVPAVKALLQSAKDPRVRIQALYVLEGVETLNTDIVNEALKDPSPGIRENAAILAERFPSCLPQLEKLIDDSSARVAFQATLSLGGFSGENITDDLVKVLKKYGSNPWFRAAVLTSESGYSVDMLKRLTAKDSFLNEDSSWRNDFLHDISDITGKRNKKEKE